MVFPWFYHGFDPTGPALTSPGATALVGEEPQLSLAAAGAAHQRLRARGAAHGAGAEGAAPWRNLKCPWENGWENGNNMEK